MRNSERDWAYWITDGKCFYCFEELAHDYADAEQRYTAHGPITVYTKQVLTVDHVIPRSRGGSDDYENLVPACARCNCQKGAMTTREYRVWLQNKTGGPVRFVSDTKKMPRLLQGY